MLKLQGKSLIRNKVFTLSQSISPRMTNYEEENSNLTVEKPGQTSLTKWSLNIDPATKWHDVLPDSDTQRTEGYFCGICQSV